ncbi:MAG: DUF4233 domain-containing protein [Longispora sp.]|nr:DUF4233 domain-containing protein [Longispora sp. (in: high G+C Gram-positive bacteria)]
MSEEGRPSGLRNPIAAVRGVGALSLGVEGVTLLLAIQPIRILGAHLTGFGVIAMFVLSVACFILAGLLRHPWAWRAGTALQFLVIAGGLFQWGIAVVGVVFLGTWLYALQVRRSVLGQGSGSREVTR